MHDMHYMSPPMLPEHALAMLQGSFVSLWAHLGGFLCGLFPSFFFLPNLKDKRCVALVPNGA